MKFPTPLIMLLGGLLQQPSFADCNSLLPATTADSQFTLLTPTPGAAVVRDDKTALMWMRCSLGQRWEPSGNQCLNDSTQTYNFTWPQALAAANSSNYGGLSHWRLPNKKELASLLDLHCVQPAINSNIFPDTPSGRFWSATPVTYSDQFYAWYVDFKEGGYGNLGSDSSLWVRLVRDDAQ